MVIIWNEEFGFNTFENTNQTIEILELLNADYMIWPRDHIKIIKNLEFIIEELADIDRYSDDYDHAVKVLKELQNKRISIIVSKEESEALDKATIIDYYDFGVK